MYVFAFADDKKLCKALEWLGKNRFPAWMIDWPTREIKVFCKGAAEKLIKGLIEEGLSANNISIDKPGSIEGFDSIWQV